MRQLGLGVPWGPLLLPLGESPAVVPLPWNVLLASILPVAALLVKIVLSRGGIHVEVTIVLK